MMESKIYASDAKTMEDGLKRVLAEMLILHLFSEREHYIGELTEAVERRSGGKLSVISPYKVFYRLAGDGYVIESRKRIAPDGRLRLYYRITDEGKEYLCALQAVYRQYTEGVSAFFASKGDEQNDTADS